MAKRRSPLILPEDRLVLPGDGGDAPACPRCGRQRALGVREAGFWGGCFGACCEDEPGSEEGSEEHGSESTIPIPPVECGFCFGGPQSGFAPGKVAVTFSGLDPVDLPGIPRQCDDDVDYIDILTSTVFVLEHTGTGGIGFGGCLYELASPICQCGQGELGPEYHYILRIFASLLSDGATEFYVAARIRIATQSSDCDNCNCCTNATAPFSVFDLAWRSDYMGAVDCFSIDHDAQKVNSSAANTTCWFALDRNDSGSTAHVTALV